MMFLMKGVLGGIKNLDPGAGGDTYITPPDVIPSPDDTLWEHLIATSSTGQYCLLGLEGPYLYKSSDYGDTWSEITNSIWAAGYVKPPPFPPPPTTQYVLDAVISNNGQFIAIIVGESEIFISIDGGSNWSSELTSTDRLHHLVANPDCSKMACFCDESSGFSGWVSTNKGGTWTNETIYRSAGYGGYIDDISSIINAHMNIHGAIAIHIGVPEGSGNDTLLSYDLLQTMESVITDNGLAPPSEVLYNTNIGPCMFSTITDQIIGTWNTTEDTIAYSQNGTTSWSYSYDVGSAYGSYYDMLFYRADRCAFITTYGYVFESFDGGENWTEVEQINVGSGLYKTAAAVNGDVIFMLTSGASDRLKRLAKITL